MRFRTAIARTAIGGHFPRWGVAEARDDRSAEGVLHLFIARHRAAFGPQVDADVDRAKGRTGQFIASS